jgi:hypothetical protein
MKRTFEKLAPFVPATAFTIFAKIKILLRHVDCSKSSFVLKKISVTLRLLYFFFRGLLGFFRFFSESLKNFKNVNKCFFSEFREFN